MLQHISPHFVAGSTNQTKSATSSGEDSPGTSTSHERSPSPTDRDASSPRNSAPSLPSTPTPMKHSTSEQSCDESSDEPILEPRRRLQTAAMKKAMDTSPLRPMQPRDDVEDVEEEADEDRSRPDSRCESPPPPEILTQRVSISQRLCDKLNGAIIRRALKQEQDQREPVVVLNHQRLLLRDRMETASPPSVEEGEDDDDDEEEEEDTDSNVPLDLSLNAEEKLKREQTELFLRQHKKEDGSESDDSGGPGEDRGRAYKKSLMKRYRKYLRRRGILSTIEESQKVERVSIY